MDDGMSDFLRVAFFLIVGCVVVPGLCQLLFFDGPVLGAAIPVFAVVWILYHVYSGLAE